MNNDLFKRILVVIFGIFVFRFGSHIPVPGVNLLALDELVNSLNGTVFDIFNTLSGGSLSRFSVFAIGVMPYITASIVIHVFTFFIPYFSNLKDEGGEGRIKLRKITFYTTVAIALIQSVALVTNIGRTAPELLLGSSVLDAIVIISTLVAGTLFLIFMGDLITQRGIGNGMSLLIYASIVSTLPNLFFEYKLLVSSGEISAAFALLVVVIFVLFLTSVVFFEKGQRRIPLISSQKFNTAKAFLPFKINLGGIIPVIFASTLMMLPNTLATFVPSFSETGWLVYIQRGEIFYYFVYAVMIIMFSIAYVRATNNPKSLAENLKMGGSLIPTKRPGFETEKYLSGVIGRISIIGAIYITMVAILPEIVINKYSVPFYMGGTSVLIVVMLALDWETQLEIFKNKKGLAGIQGHIDDVFQERK